MLKNNSLFTILLLLAAFVFVPRVDAGCGGGWTCGISQDTCSPDTCSWAECNLGVFGCHITSECNSTGYAEACIAQNSPGACNAQVLCPYYSCSGPHGSCTWTNPPPTNPPPTNRPPTSRPPTNPPPTNPPPTNVPGQPTNPPPTNPPPTSPPCTSWNVTCCDGTGDSLSCAPGTFSNYSHWAGEACGDNGGYQNCPVPTAGLNPTSPPSSCSNCGWCTSPNECAASGGTSIGHGYCTEPNDVQCCVCNTGGPPGNPGPPVYSIRGHVKLNGASVNTHYTIRDVATGEGATWTEETWHYFSIGEWDTPTTRTIELTNPPVDYTCNWQYKRNVSGEIVRQGWDDCTAEMENLMGFAWDNYLVFDIVPIPYINIAGTIRNSSTNVGIPNVVVEVYDENGDHRSITTNSNGWFVVENFIEIGEFYAVRLPDPAPHPYLDPVKSTTTSYSYDFATNADTPPGSLSYENQRAGSNDCSGPNASNQWGRCDFEYDRCNILSPATIDFTCSADYSTATLNWSAPGAEYYSLRVDRSPSSFNTDCDPTNPGDECMNTFDTSITLDTSGNKKYDAWVHGRNTCGEWGDAAIVQNVVCPLGRIQGRRIGASERGVAYAVVNEDSGAQVGNRHLLQDHMYTYSTGDILKGGDTYIVYPTPPSSGYDSYSSLCENCITHDTNLFCDISSSHPHCYQYGSNRTVTIPTTDNGFGVYYNNLNWQFVPHLDISSVTISAGHGAVPPPTALNSLSGLLENYGGKSYNNAIRITQIIEVGTGNIQDVGMSGVAFISSTEDHIPSCIGQTGRKFIPFSNLTPKIDDVEGFMITYVHNAAYSPDNDPSTGVGFYLYNGDGGQWSYGGSTIGTFFGSEAYGLVVRVLSFDYIGGTNWQYVYEALFYSDSDQSRRNRTWKAVGYTKNSSTALSASRELVDICN